MTTLTGTKSFSETLVGPTPGQPRTAASVNTGLQQAINNTTSIYYGRSSYKYLSSEASSLVVAGVEDPLIVQSFPAASPDTVSYDFEDDAEEGTSREFIVDYVDQGTVFNFRDSAGTTTHATWTAEASFRQLHFRFLYHSGAWVLVEAWSPWRGVTEKSYTDTVNGVLILTAQMQDVYFHADPDETTAIPGNIRIFLPSSGVAGSIHNFYFSKLLNTISVSILTGVDEEIFEYPASGNLENAHIAICWSRDTGWRVLTANHNPRSEPGMLWVPSPVPAHLSINPNTYRYVMFAPKSSLTSCTISQDGTYYGQEITICCRRLSSPNGELRIAYEDQEYVLSASDEDTSTIEKAATFVWVQAEEDRWVLKSGSEQT